MLKEFDKEAYIKSMNVPVAKLIKDLDKLGITFVPDDHRGQSNVVFIEGDRVLRMSKHSFYRFGGMSQLSEVKEKEQFITITKVTDDMWLQNVIKPIVIKLLNFV